MMSPFPGMDPYLERNWRDVHNTLISGAREALNCMLPPNLVARSEDRVYVETEGEPSRRIHPDVRVSVQSPVAVQSTPQGATAVIEPVLIEIDGDPVTEPFIQIMESDGSRVITAAEFISPANKRIGDEGREAYLKKRREFFARDANLVEIDLTRGCDWLALLRPYRIPERFRTTYRAAVRRARRPEKAELYPISIRDRLPTVAVPLRAQDEDVKLDLQELFDRAYESGRYGATNYRLPCEPPLTGEDAEWADRLLQSAGRR